MVDDVILGVEGFGTKFDETMPEVERVATFEDVVVEIGCRGARFDEVMLCCVVTTGGAAFEDNCRPVTLDDVVVVDGI